MHSSNNPLWYANKPQAILITGYADSPLIFWVASQQWFSKGESTREESDALKQEEVKSGDQPDMDRWMVNGVWLGQLHIHSPSVTVK